MDIRIVPTPHLEVSKPAHNQHVVQVTLFNETTYLTRNEAACLAGRLNAAVIQKELGVVK
jgi:hypothetical protein